jgi:type IV secretory pathway TraG/TraD family ATPase VirD4
MLILVSGHYPILGTQMLYFADPELKKRSEIAPPLEFIAIENGGSSAAPTRSYGQCNQLPRKTSSAC